MAYKLEHVAGDHLSVLVETMRKWSNSQPDMYIISEEGHKIYTHKLLVSFYSATLASILDSRCSNDMPGVSILASSNSIVNLMKVLATGIAISYNKADLQAVNKTAEAMGIQMDHWQIGVKNRGAAKNENKSSLKKKSVVSEPRVKQEVIENSQEKKYACADCGKQFGKKSHLTRHELTHSGVRYPCDLCGSIFKRKEGLKFHLRKEHDTELTEEEALVNDVKLENDDANILQSEMDEAAVLDEVSQTDEVWTATEGEDPSLEADLKYCCNQCEKIFKNPKHLKRHEALHSGVKFTCNECPSTFSRKDKLTAHMRKKHSSLAENDGSPQPLENVDREVDTYTKNEDEGENEEVENKSAMEINNEDANMKLECPYCQEMVEDLADHCLEKHNNEDAMVNDILNQVQSADIV